MSLSPRQIIGKLNEYGHLSSPFGQPSQLWPTAEEIKLTLRDEPVKAAVASYQSMHATTLEPLIAKHHPSRHSAVVIPDGDIGPATAELFQIERCSVPDYALAVEPLKGSGNWFGCHNIGNFHAVLVSIKSSTIPARLKPLLPEMLALAQQSYDEMGLHFICEYDVPGAELTMSFEKLDSGVIGLAMVLNNQMCGDRGWCKFSPTYAPPNLLSEYVTLIRHEWGHNTGLSHSQGGCMNPFIKPGLRPSWRGDPSEALLKRRFGGVPVPTTTPRIRERWICLKNPDGSFVPVMEIPQDDDGGLFPKN